MTAKVSQKIRTQQKPDSEEIRIIIFCHEPDSNQIDRL